ncbi:TAFII28-domain-containing protein [Coccomyxa subellipsoidea C-169]|uniref:Transcription initiation factor TFIID subunit 11 n=1 Tax=Coccomyxa subellipsoidea (strain C-169) TaxID=574566 RepID=I0YMJ3_COCSC|nr:TAFII28-domain-containing protein [Coccomyxa subellipsoidea C-169]EIE19612.1 TAFII28-domain-containing protein [Coccomyxa subellipsoidea C-169]|eukprot:XP_005644156.1 TAFII28-domain-containing protein [Coccomyxa subellipsoidea C-169]
MEEDDDFNLEDELERELEAGMDVDEEDEEASAATHAVAATSAAVSSGPQPSGEGAADDLTSAVAAVELGKTQAFDAVQQLEALKQERQRKNQEVLKLLTPEQMDRYEAFRRSKLAKPSMRKLLHSVTGQAPHMNSTIVMCGIAKLFVGDLVETARMVAAEMGDNGPLRPAHLQEAYQKLDRQGKIPHSTRKPRRMRML